jgi:hypothetical protein
VPGGDGRGDNHEALNRPVWQVHAYGPAAVRGARELAERHRDKAAGVTRPASGGRPSRTAPERGDGEPGATELPVYAFRAAPEQGLPDGTAVLVRPDGFVAEVLSAAVPESVPSRPVASTLRR